MTSRSAGASDTGSTSLSTALLTPVFMVLALMAFQAAMWAHARTEARAIVRDSAAMVARSGADAADIESSTERMLQADTNLSHVEVELTVDGGVVVARVTARAPGLIRGTSAAFVVIEAMPIEGVR